MTPRSVASHERRELERHETREKILDAARQLFAEKGYEAVTMRAIAEHISYTATAIYHHFESKQALCTELCSLDFRRLARRFQQVGAVADPVERLRSIGVAYVEFADANPNHYRYLFMTVLPQIGVAAVHAGHVEDEAHRLADQHRQVETDAYAFLRQTCQEAIDQKRFRPEHTDADELAQMLWGALHGLISLRIVKARDVEGVPNDVGVPWRDIGTTARHTIDVLIRGMLREPAG